MATLNKAFWNLFKPITGTKRFTLEDLRDQYAALARNPVVTEANRAVVVETIRSIAEYMIWGDQNEPRIFDFFLENNIMVYLQQVLMQPANRTGEVAKQVLQTLSIIIQNVRSETAIFFLFSNNHINNIVDLDFDFDDEEVLGYYISFLKTISLKLNRGTVQFFINAGKDQRSFPLYTRAIRLAHNHEGMVRAAVRTLTLHVYSVVDPDIQEFVTSPPASQHFTEVALYLATQIQLLDSRLHAAESGGSQPLASLDSQLAEVEDVVSYVSDLLSLGVPAISQLLASSLWQAVIQPLLLKPLMEPGAAASPALQQQQAGQGWLSSCGSRGAGIMLAAGGLPGTPAHLRHPSWGNGPAESTGSKQQGTPHMRPVCAIYVLERLFHLVMYPPLLQQLLLALTCASSGSSSSSSSSSGNSSSRVSCRSTLLGILASNQAYPAMMVLRLLVAILHSRHISPELLAALSLLPRKQQQEHGGFANSAHADDSNSKQDPSQLASLVQAVLSQLQELRASEPEGAVPAAVAINSSSGSSMSVDLLKLLTQQYLPNKLESLVERHSVNVSSVAASTSSNSIHHAESMQGLDAWLKQAELNTSSDEAATAASYAFSSLGPQLVAALLQLLQQSVLPPLGLRLLGWLLHQLLPIAPVVGDAAAATPGPGHRRQQSAASDIPVEEVVHRAYSVASSIREDGDISDSSSEGGYSGTAGSTEDSVPGSSLVPPVSTAPSSVQSYSVHEPRGSVLSAQQQQQLYTALQAAQLGFLEQLGSMWCEAVFPMLALEWPTSREGLARPVLRAGSDALLSGTAVWPLLLELEQQQVAAGAAAAGLDALSESGKAALGCYLAVQRVVALTQVHELLLIGTISPSPPVPTVTEADLKQVDIQEGYQVDLAPGSALQCVVSFAPGQERRVYFAVAGLSRQQLAAVQGSTAGQQVADNSNPGSSTASGHQHEQQHLQASLLRSLPVTVLADSSPSRPQAGIVLSVAPVLGAAPYADPGVSKWLHVHVRPSVRGLLRVIKTAAAKKGGLLSAMRQLADGHWVLAFSSGDKAAAAVHLVQQHAAHLRRLYGDALAPLCSQQQRQQPQQQQQVIGQELQQQQQVKEQEQQQHQEVSDQQQQQVPVQHQQPAEQGQLQSMQQPAHPLEQQHHPPLQESTGEQQQQVQVHTAQRVGLQLDQPEDLQMSAEEVPEAIIMGQDAEPLQQEQQQRQAHPQQLEDHRADGAEIVHGASGLATPEKKATAKQDNMGAADVPGVGTL